MTTSLAFGDIRVDRVVESEGPFIDAHTFFPKLTPEMFAEHRDWLVPRYFDAGGKLIITVQSYVVRTRHHTILVDSCVGNDKPRPNRPMWHMQTSDRYERGLEALGLGFGDIDFVMCTHLHVDHTGWNTRLDNGRWVPTFPNARYLFADRELAFWTERQKNDPATCPWVTDSVLPIVAAGRCDTVRSDHAFDDEVRLIPSPGHTIDHYCVELGRGRADAIITGDMIHSPLQARYPEIGMFADYSSEMAGQTRRKLFERICDTPTTLCTAHFPQPSACRLTRWADGFRCIDSLHGQLT